ncbi:MAG: MFS transporter [Puniceicoccales bacterium]|jgi:phosphoglycerate transporter family protein|nr:MFS transporter [Puniceicoccales bacterium]
MWHFPFRKIRRDDVGEQYKYWRGRILYSLIIGYATFYLVRQNFQVATPKMLDELGYTRSEIGWVFSAFAIIYGVGKFVSGMICDRTNARYFMTIGLIGSALCSLLIGFSNSLTALVVFYALNGAFQSAGWPPVSRLMTQWYSPEELGTKWGIVSASHQLGGIIILVTGAHLSVLFGWRSVFVVPAAIAMLLAVFLFERLRDSPQSLGLPSIEEKESLAVDIGQHSDAEEITLKEVLFKHILPNKALWYVCMANFFVYIIRMGFFNWAPTFLREACGTGIVGAAWQNVAFEFMGSIGGIVAGWASDKVFHGRRNCTAFYFMLCLIFSLFLFWKMSSTSVWINTIFLFLMGFFIYGPQTLVGISGAEFGSRRAAATGNGLTGLFGYIGGAVSGFGVGKIADKWGWNAAFLFFILCAAAGAFFFMLNWDKTSQKYKIKV